MGVRMMTGVNLRSGEQLEVVRTVLRLWSLIRKILFLEMWMAREVKAMGSLAHRQ